VSGLKFLGMVSFALPGAFSPAKPSLADFNQKFHNDTGILSPLQCNNTPRIHNLIQHNMSNWPRKAHSSRPSADPSPSRYATRLTHLLQLL